MNGASPRIIKRYSNRKLYDTEASTYITLSEIGVLIREGVDVRVVDHTSGEDLTPVTLAQVLLDDEKKRSPAFSSQSLRTLVEQGEDALTFIKDAVGNVVTEAERRRGWIERHLTGTSDEVRKAAKDLFSTTQQSVTDMQTQIDQQLDSLFARLSLVTQLKREVSMLRGRLKSFEDRLDRLETARLKPEPRSKNQPADKRKDGGEQQ